MSQVCLFISMISDSVRNTSEVLSSSPQEIMCGVPSILSISQITWPK